jgi:hypothetical protein
MNNVDIEDIESIEREYEELIWPGLWFERLKRRKERLESAAERAEEESERPK